MSDADIVKAVECCAEWNCIECPRLHNPQCDKWTCRHLLFREIPPVIRRKEEQLDMLKKSLEMAQSIEGRCL